MNMVRGCGVKGQIIESITAPRQNAEIGTRVIKASGQPNAMRPLLTMYNDCVDFGI